MIPPLDEIAFSYQLTPWTLLQSAERIATVDEEKGEALREFAETFAEIRSLPVYIAGNR